MGYLIIDGGVIKCWVVLMQSNNVDAFQVLVSLTAQMISTLSDHSLSTLHLGNFNWYKEDGLVLQFSFLVSSFLQC